MPGVQRAENLPLDLKLSPYNCPVLTTPAYFLQAILSIPSLKSLTPTSPQYRS